MPFNHSEKHLLLRYLLIYMGVFLLLLALLLPIRRRVYSLAKNQLVEQTNVALKEGLGTLSHNIGGMQDSSVLVWNDDDFLALSRRSGALEASGAVHLLRLRELLQLLSVNQDATHKGLYMLFSDNPAIVSNMFVSEDYETVYPTLLSYQALHVQLWRSHLLSPASAVSFLPAMPVQSAYFSESGPCEVMTCVVALQGSRAAKPSGALAYMLDVSLLCDGLLTQDILRYGRAMLVDARGSVLLTVGDEAIPALSEEGPREWAVHERYIGFAASDTTFGLQLTASLPERVIYDSIRQLTAPIDWIITLGLAVGALSALFYAMQRFLPMRRLLKTGQRLSGHTFIHDDEYRFIQDVMVNIANTKDAFEKRLYLLRKSQQEELLRNACTRRIFSQNEHERLEALYGALLARYVVTVMQWEEDAGQPMLEVEAYLSAQWKHPPISLHMGLRKLVVFLPMDAPEQTMKEVERLLESAAGYAAPLSDVPMRMGVSQVHEGVAQISQAYWQAEHAVHCGLSQQGACYAAADMPMEDGMGIVEPGILAKLRELILAGSTPEVSHLFAQLVEQYRAALMPEHSKMQHYLALQMVVEQAMRAVYRTDLPGPISYREEWPMEKCLTELAGQAQAACQAVQSKRHCGNAQLCESLLEHIRRNYHDANLSAQSMASAFQVSEKYVYKLIKEHTGRSLGEWIEEVRVEQVENYLLKTDWSIQEIALRTGYVSLNTCYRAFRKKHGTAPGVWRAGRHNATY